MANFKFLKFDIHRIPIENIDPSSNFRTLSDRPQIHSKL